MVLIAFFHILNVKLGLALGYFSFIPLISKMRRMHACATPKSKSAMGVNSVANEIIFYLREG